MSISRCMPKAIWLIATRIWAIWMPCGINSATVRASSIHRYLPEEYRARINAFSGAAICTAGSVMSLLIGALGEILDYRIAMAVVALICASFCYLTVGRNKTELDQIYLYSDENET